MSKNSIATIYKLHPFVIFWLGVLTGALAIAVLFMFNGSRQFQDNALRVTPVTTRSTTVTPTTVKSNSVSTQLDAKAILPDPIPGVPAPKLK